MHHLQNLGVLAMRSFAVLRRHEITKILFVVHVLLYFSALKELVVLTPFDKALLNICGDGQ